MKNHALIFTTLAVFITLSGCKTQKSTQRNTDIKRETESIESSLSQSLETKEAGSKISISATQAIWEIIRRVEFDSLGNVRAVQETRRGSGRSELALRNDSSRGVSVNNTAEAKKTNIELDSTSIQKSDLKVA